jgi:Predicted permeases
LFGSSGVFFAVVSLAGFNIFSWTHGISLFKNTTENESIKWKEIILNPNIVAIVLGLLMFVFSLRIPTTLNQVVKYVGSINTPLSMIIIGNSLANIEFNKKMLDKNLGLAIILRNIFFLL